MRTRFRYVFDAKYRINPAPKETPYYNAYRKPGPQEDDINTMHRYRDALVYRQDDGEYKRGTFGAVILFPYGDEDKYSGERDRRPHRFFESIEQVGIGGLPFLPGHTRLVEGLLDDLVLASPETAHEQGRESEGAQQYYQERFAQRNVLVGVVSRHDHLTYHQEIRTYHIPAEHFPKGFAHVKYVALYESRRVKKGGFMGVRSYGGVVNARLVNRADIPIPSQSGRPANTQYVLFTIDEWQQVGPITPAGYGVRNRIYTTLYLLRRARHLPELSLKSEMEIRLWKELQRLGQRVRVQVQSEIISEDTEVQGFEINGRTVRVVGEKILLDEALIAEASDLRVRPMYVLNLMR